jgi:predicted AAA+ superfamily ATPase
MNDPVLFPGVHLSGALVQNLRRMNPWWEGRPLPPLPSTRRHLVGAIHRRLDANLAPIVVLRGPRQIGKSTAQEHVIEDLLTRENIPPSCLMRVQFDELKELAGLGTEPILRLVDWYEDAILKQPINAVARSGGKVFLFVDEVQNLDLWHVQLKSLVDLTAVQVVVTGSSALRIEQGRDSLAGRITTIEAGTLTLTEIGGFRGLDVGAPALPDNGLSPVIDKAFWRELARRGRVSAAARDRAFAWFSERGGYPAGHKQVLPPWPQLADLLNETVIQRVIRQDLQMGEGGRKRDAALLEELFRLACRYAGQTPDVETFGREVRRVLAIEVSLRRVQQYLKLLADSLLLRMVPPLEIRLRRPRGAPKLCLADHALRASWLQEVIPLDPAALAVEPHLTTLAGRLAESVVGSTFSSIHGLDVAYVPEMRGEPEVDFVLTVGTSRVPVEVKYQRRIDPLRDTEGLRTFIEKAANNAPFGLLITQTDGAYEDDPRIVSLPLSTLMLLR